MRARRGPSIVLAVLTAVLLAATAVSGYARSELTDPDAFAARVSTALDDPDARAVLADSVVSRLSDAVAPDLLNLRPLLVPALAAALDTAAFRRVFERALRARHRRLAEGESRFVLELEQGARVIVRALRGVSPRFAAALPEDLEIRLAVLEPRRFELVAARVIGDLAGWFWALAAVTLVVALGCAALAGGLRPALVLLGAAVAGAAWPRRLWSRPRGCS